MKVVAVSVGRPQEVQWRGRSVQTSIFKTPISHRVNVAHDNIEGDEQSDLSVHGGPEKAVYAYPMEHYDFWRRELPDAELPWGAFGENLTTEGLLEGEVWIGDRYRIGTTELVVTQPRMPCYKLAIRFGHPDVVRRFLKSRRSGFYLAVVREGDIGAGDAIERLARSDNAPDDRGRGLALRDRFGKPGIAGECERPSVTTSRVARIFPEALMGARCMMPVANERPDLSLNADVPHAGLRLRSGLPVRPFGCGAGEAP